MDLQHSELELVDALASFANSVDPTTRLPGLVARGAELIGVFSGAKYVAVYIHSTEREEYGTWPEDLSDASVENRAKAVWAGEESAEEGEIAMALQRGPNRIGAVVASVELLDSRHRALFRSISNQLSLVLENALLLRAGSGRAVFESEPDRLEREEVVGPLPRVFYGEPVAAGFASGKVLRWEESTDFEEGDTTGAVDLDRAFLDSREQLINLKTEATRSVDDTVATIFDAHLLMLSDPQFIGRIRDMTESGETAIRATRLVVGEFAGTLASMDDPRFSEKAQDVRDLGIRLIRNLRGESGSDRSYSDVVVIAEEMYPSELVSLAAQRVGGIVFVGSGLTAHISILARSLEIPSVITQDKLLLRVEDDLSIAIDGDAGRVLLEPETSEIEKLSREGESRRAELADISGLSEIYMRLEQHQLEHRPAIRANINLFHDADRARSLQADGIGLYRSEFPFIIRSDYLSEEEQYGIYRRIGDAMPDQPLVFRTADIGGDKILPSIDVREANPFLGVRGIRFSLANPHMF